MQYYNEYMNITMNITFVHPNFTAYNIQCCFSIWAEKLPVRIECFSVNQSQRSRIGYIILNVKDAQIAQDEAKVSGICEQSRFTIM